MYDTNNIFAKIISGKIDSEKVYEDDSILAIKDINPVAPVHILIMPKKAYIDFDDFISKATDKEIHHYFTSIKNVAESLRVIDYRLVSNRGESAGQSVFHFHTHLIGGKNIHELIDNID